MTSPNGGRAPAPAAALPDPGCANRADGAEPADIHGPRERPRLPPPPPDGGNRLSRRRPAAEWWAALGLALVICGALLASAGRTTLWDRDEPRFAQATAEMIGSGNYLVPTLNGRLRPDKPVLVYWLMSLPMRLLGPTALAARACSAVAVALAALFTFSVARRLLPAPAGLWAMAMLAATPLALAEGQAATADAVLLAAVAAALACFAAAVDGPGAVGDVGADGGLGAAGRPGAPGAPGSPGSPGGWQYWLGLGVALGLAQLAKGPVGLALPGLGVAATLWLLRRPAVETAASGDPGAAAAPGSWAAAAAWRAALAALLGVALFCAWGVPANRASGGELARLGLGRHVLGRAWGAMEGHGGGGPLAGIPYYVLVVWVGFAPWSLYLPAAISAALGGRLGGRRGRALLVGWTAPALLLMAVVATRLPNYILPVWPVLALAVAGTLEAERRGGLSPRDRRWLRRGAWPLAALLVLVLLGAAAVAAVAVVAIDGSDGRRLPAAAPVAAALARDLLPPVLAVAVVILAAGGAALREHLAGRFRRSALLHLGGVLGAAAVAGLWLAPALERWKPAPRLALAVRAAAAPGEPVAAYGYDEPSLGFYLRRGTVSELGDAAAVAAWCRVAAPGILVLPRGALGELRLAPAVANLREIAAASGFNISKGSLLELVALERGGKPGTAVAAFPVSRR